MLDLLYKSLLLFCCCCFCTQAISQSSARHSICLVIPEMAILDIEPTNAVINLRINAPIEGGESVALPKGDGTKWLNYTSAISPSGANRSVAAQISGGTLPEGVRLYLEASNSTGNGGGTLGKSTGKITLNTSPKAIINNIGRGYTGKGSNNGHKLTYSLGIEDYKKLNATTNQQVMVVFTITE